MIALITCYLLVSTAFGSSFLRDPWQASFVPGSGLWMETLVKKDTAGYHAPR